MALEVDVGAATLRISSDTTLGDLYRAHIEYAGTRPGVELDPTSWKLRISQSGGGFPSLRGDRFTMDLTLNTSVPWSIVENSGAVTETLKIPDLELQSLDINTGASHDDITVGPPSGVVPIHVNGGALTVHITRAGGADASIHVSGGAVSLTADGNSYHAIGSASYATPKLGSDRYAVEVNGGAFNPIAPFGGYKQSGIGRETHKMMLDHYQQTKNLLVSYSAKALGFF